MASWTTPVIPGTGQPLPSTAFAGVANNTTFLWQKPFCSYYDSAGTGIPSGADTIVQLGGTTFVNYGWTISGNTLTVPVTGIYQINFRIGYQIISTGSGFSQVFHNGNAILFGSTVTFASTNYVSQSVGSGLLPCNAGDGLYLVAYQSNTSGAMGTGETVITMVGSAQTAIEVFLVGSQ